MDLDLYGKLMHFIELVQVLKIQLMAHYKNYMRHLTDWLPQRQQLRLITAPTGESCEATRADAYDRPILAAPIPDPSVLIPFGKAVTGPFLLKISLNLVLTHDTQLPKI